MSNRTSGHDQLLRKSAVFQDPPPPPPPQKFTAFCCYKFWVVFYGFFFLVIGLIILGTGIYAERMTRDYIPINDEVKTPPILAIVVGITIILTAIIGVAGALKESIILLRIFLVIIILMFIFQIVIGILAFVYREEASTVITDQFKFAIAGYDDDDHVKRSIDHVQNKFSCCGLVSPGDWEDSPAYSCYGAPKYPCSVPGSCCGKLGEEENHCGYNLRRNTTLRYLRSQKVNINGCIWHFLHWVEENMDIVGATALGFAIPQILAMLLVYVYMNKIYEKSKLFKYRKRVWSDS